MENPSQLSRVIRVFFRYPSPKILLTASALYWGYRIHLGGWSLWDLAVAAAIIVTWPLREWLIHVHLLHFKPKRIFGRDIDLKLGVKHRAHHNDPADIDNVFIPMHTFYYAFPLNLIIWNLVMPTTALAFTWLAVDMTFSFYYEWVHYFVHTRYTPKSAFFKRLKFNHQLHHYKNENYWFGVSMLSGDWILRTTPDPKTIEMSPTCRNLQ